MANIKIEKKDSFRIEYTKGDTYALKLTFKNVDQDLTSAIFTVKENHEDATPLIEKTIGAGITKLDENFYKRELVYKLQLQATDSQFLEADHLYLYDLKIAVGNVVKTVIKGNFVVTYNVTSVDRMTTEIVDIEIDDAIDTDAETTPATHGIEYETDPIATAQIGDMTELTTTAKETLVDAINEIEPKASSALEEITNIEDGTVTVPNATHATNADNATNYNTLSGSIKTKFDDIEERLTNLGFKQGSVTLSSGTTAETNILTRQGNYVLGKLVNVLTPSALSFGTVPAEFRPKAIVTFGITGRFLMSMSGFSNTTSYGDGTMGYITITNTGDISITRLSGTVSSGQGIAIANQQEYQGYFDGAFTCYFGYEANPI